MIKLSRRIVYISIAASCISCLLVITMMIILPQDTDIPEEETIIVETGVLNKPAYDSTLKRDIVKSNKSIDDEIMENPAITKEDLPLRAANITPPSDTDSAREHKAKGREEELSTIELDGEGWVGVFGVGGSNGGAFGYRSGGGRKRPYGPGYTGTEQYEFINENRFLDPFKNPLSTFSIDVDTASYANIRRFLLRENRFPPADAVRIEEMINYFSYRYPEPEGKVPFSISAEVASCPWNTDHSLVHIGIRGRHINRGSIPPANLVFLLDVSGSMEDPDKLPLLQSSFRLLVSQLRKSDRVSIVTYADSARIVLNPTPGIRKETIINAIDSLSASGSTAGEAGLRMAYDLASLNFNSEYNNRIILATDGDFNVGVRDDDELVRIITEKREKGVFLSILGFGRGNYKDAKMEKIADCGNGNYSYIDSILEGKKVLMNEFGGTMVTIAKDVKIQVEFNPAKVGAYRLIGYENRKLKKEDFNNDKKDAGELGADHTVTALYEIVPAGVQYPGGVDRLKYQKNEPSPRHDPQLSENAYKSNELMTVKLRYKAPDSDRSSKITGTILDIKTDPDDNFNFSAAVAAFGMLLRNSEYAGSFSFPKVAALAKSAKGDDENGYRAEFIKMVETCSLLADN